jgi:carboxyl-terminal processing protease
MAAASALAPAVLWAEQREPADSATSQAVSPRIATFEEVWRTVRDRFYDPHLHGLDWSAVRERYLPDATRASSEEALASVINAMLSELSASHTRYYTPYEPEYYQLSDIFAGALRRRGLERAFPSGRISYPGIGVLSRLDMQGRSMITGVIEGTPAQQAGLLAGDVIVFADGASFQPVQSFRGKVGKEVALGLRRAGAFMQISVTPVDIEPNKMFLDGLKASARIIRANGRSIGYVHVWCYAGSVYQRTLEHLLSKSPLNGADALIWDLRDGWGGAIPEYLDLFNTRAPTMQVTDRNGASDLANVKWRKPVAMLVNGGTRSGKEVLSYGFKKYGYGKIVGERSAGALLAGRAYMMSNGNLLLLAVTDVSVDGDRLEGRGVTPDITVPFDIRYAGGKDPQLARALDLLTETPSD